MQVIKHIDSNEPVRGMYRNSTSRKTRKLKEHVKYKDEFTSVRDDIGMIAKDVAELMLHRSGKLGKGIAGKNIKIRRRS